MNPLELHGTCLLASWLANRANILVKPIERGRVDVEKDIQILAHNSLLFFNTFIGILVPLR